MKAPHRIETFASHLSQDCRYALRGLWRSPATTLTAVLALALGIGASTAVFSVVDRILFRSLPYGDAGQLVSFGFVAPAIDRDEFMLGSAYVGWRDSQKLFSSIAAWAPGLRPCDLTEANPERLACADVERTLLPTLQVTPLMGRNFTAEEDEPNGARVALITYGLWRSRFGGDPQIVGKTMSVEGQPTVVVGVLRRDFEMPTLLRADILTPLALNLAMQRPPNTGRVLRTIARLAPGITPERAVAELQATSDREQWVPARFRNGVSLRVRRLRDRQVGDYRLGSLVLLTAVIAVLLIACANVANLLLARAATRERETAVRTALGASRAQLASLALMESLLLAIAGCFAGCALAFALLRVFTRIAPQGIPRLEHATIDLRVLGFALLAAIVSGVTFALAPISRKPNPEMLVGGHSVRGERNPLRYLLIAGQMAASLVLLSSAVLLLRTFWSMEAVPLGINPTHVVTATVTLGDHRYPTPEKRYQFFEALEQRAGQLPGLEALAVSDSLPPSGAMRSKPYGSIQIEGQPLPENDAAGLVAWRAVTPGYFRALSIPIVRGRGFTEQDRSPDANAIILSETLARKMFGAGDAVGKRIRLDPSSSVWDTVVGVAQDVKNDGITTAADPEYYVARRHTPGDATARASIVVRTSLQPQAVQKWLHDDVGALDPTLPVQVETMQQRVGDLLAKPRFNAALLVIFGFMALLLAAIGVYSVTAFLVAQRTQEIGVRMALGATPGAIAKHVLGSAARWTLAGAIMGVATSLAVARIMTGLLYGPSAHDPFALGVALGVLVLVAMLAALLPAMRAAAVEPMAALRHE